MRQVFASIAVAAMVGLVAGSYLYVRMQRENLRVQQETDPYADCRGGQVGGGSIGGSFTLVDDKGATVTDRDVITGPTLVYFGYTFCPDVCPTDAARNADAVEILAKQGVAAKSVFITVDPARDTPEVLHDFARNLDPAMTGLTGTEAQVKAVSDAYRNFYRVRNSGNEDYLMDHTTLTYLMQPGADGKPAFLDFFKSDVNAQEMAAQVACYAAAV